ncbi:unnamed protein product, partial [Rotaria sordida]
MHQKVEFIGHKYHNALAQLAEVPGFAISGGGLTLDWYQFTALSLITEFTSFVNIITCDHAEWLNWYYVLLSLFIK